MEQFNINGHIVKVDVQKTKKLYEPLPLTSDKAHCGCEDCSYYAKAIVQTSPAVQRFFKQFGIDPRKEAEVWRACKNDDGTYCYTADYHFIGEIKDVPELDWIDVEEASFGLTNRTDNLLSPMIPETFKPSILELKDRGFSFVNPLKIAESFGKTRGEAEEIVNEKQNIVYKAYVNESKWYLHWYSKN